MSSAIPAGKAFVEVGLVSKISAGARQIQREAAAIGAGLKSLGTTTLASGAAMTAGFGGALAAMSFPVKLAADAEMTRAKLTALTGSAEAANTVLGELTNFAKQTPFTLDGVAKAAVVLKGYQVENENLIPTLRMLGEVSGGNQETLERLAVVFGQVRSNGKLMGDELNQIREVFNPLQYIAKATGTTVDGVTDAMSRGAVSFQDFVRGLELATSAGGDFFGSLDAQSKTFYGRLSTLTDEVTSAMLPMGEALLSFAKPALEWVRQAVSNFQGLGQYIGPVSVGLAAVSAAGVAAGVGLASAGVAMTVLGSAASAVTAVLAAGSAIIAMPVLIPVAGALASMAVGFTAVAGGITAVVYRSGLLSDALSYVRNEGGKLVSSMLDAFGGIKTALASGDFKLAAAIGWAGAKVVFLEGLHAMANAFADVFNNLWTIIKRFFHGMAQLAHDVFVSIPKMLMQVLQGANIGQMLQDAFAGNLNFGLDGKALAKARAELDQLLKQRPQQVERSVNPESRFNFGAAAQATQTSQVGSPQADEFNNRVAALQREIVAIREGADAAELLEMKQKGLTEAQLDAVASLQAARRQAELDKSNAERLKQEGESLTESMRTPIEVLHDALRRNNELFRAGAITEQTRQRADASAVDQYRDQVQQSGAQPMNTIAMQGSREAAQTLRRSMGIAGPSEWTQQLVASANAQLVATADQTSAINTLASQGITFAGLERLTQDHIDRTNHWGSQIVDAVARSKPNVVSIPG